MVQDGETWCNMVQGDGDNDGDGDGDGDSSLTSNIISTISTQSPDITTQTTISTVKPTVSEDSSLIFKPSQLNPQKLEHPTLP